MNHQPDHIAYRTWTEYCDNYQPASWPQPHRPTNIEHAANELEHVLARALRNIDRTAAA